MIMGIVSAIPKSIALEKSVLLKKSKRSLKEVDMRFLVTFKKVDYNSTKILSAFSKSVNLFRKIYKLFLY